MILSRALILSLLLAGIASAQVVVGGGSSGGGNPGQFNVKSYGAVGDARSARDCVTTNTGSTITSASNPWLSTDVGKKLAAVATSQSSFGTGTGAANNIVTISSFTSAGQISVSPSTANQSATGTCVWFTQDDTASMFAAYTAADSATALQPGYVTPTLSHAQQIICPSGGYAVSGTIYNDALHHTSNNTEGVSFIGIGNCEIYVLPSFVAPNTNAGLGTLFSFYLNQLSEFGHVSIIGMLMNSHALSAQQGLVGYNTSGRNWIHDIIINDFGTNQSNGTAFQRYADAGLSRIEGLTVQDSPGGDAGIGCYFNNAAVDIYNSFCSNHFINFKVDNGSGQRTVFGPHFALHGYQNDECGANALACFQLVNSTVNCIGCELLNPGGGVGSVSIDTNSKFYGTDVSAFAFDSDGGNSSGFVIAGNGQLYLTNSDVSGLNSNTAISGPSTALFVDVGGNHLYNQASGVLTLCTPANFGTCAFSGGVNPKATVTHTPNTCYATSGTLVATQNLCTFLNDQNYQVLNITAQSGGNSPTNSSCATAPVVTLSDGTRTATLTLTTGKTQWSSAVDASTVNSIFASGTTLTISVGTFTCATPPANLAVSYVLQSVLNP